VTDFAIALPVMPAATPAPARSGVPTANGEPAGAPADAAPTEEPSTDPFAALLAAVVASVLPMPVQPDLVVTPEVVPETPVFDPALSAGVALGQPLSELAAAAAQPVGAEAFGAVAEAAMAAVAAGAPAATEVTPSAAPSVDASPVPEAAVVLPDIDQAVVEPEAAVTTPTPRPAAPPQARASDPEDGGSFDAEVEVEIEAVAVPSTSGTSATDAPAPITQVVRADVVTPLAATATTSPVDAIEAPSAAAPAAPRPVAPPHAQIVSHVSPLLQRPDGSYHVSVRLRPEELGGVRIDVHLVDGQVSLQLRADTQVGHEALRTSLPQLRHELEAAGVSPGTLDLGDWAGNQQSPADTSRRQTAPTFTAEPLPAELVGLIDAAAEDAVLDVRM
jgi:hypothetical protein